MKKSGKEQAAFDEKTLQHFKNTLLEKRRRAEEELDKLDENIQNLADVDDADYSSIAHHMGDVGTDIEEEELNYKLRERTEKYIRQLDSALDRIEAGTYGVCQATGKVISKERLEAVPHTRYSIEAKQQGPVEDA